jgi:pimeloyl-ACP methyl ester carboxylesterase
MPGSPNETIQPKTRTIDGLSIRYAESESRDDHAILISPWPESLFAYDQTWSRLSAGTHLVAVDLPGFGGSERRGQLMSPHAMSEFLVHVADEFGLESPHVVGPDIGTGTALFAAALHPGRFRSLVVGSGGAAVPLQLSGVLKDWVEDPDYDKYRAADPKQVVEIAMSTIEGYTVPDEIVADYVAANRGERFFESMRYARAYPTDLPILGRLLIGIETPVQHIAGRRDAVVPVANSEYLHERLPHSKLDVVDAGHFVWEEAPDEYADLVTAWWAGGYRAV